MIQAGIPEFPYAQSGVFVHAPRPPGVGGRPDGSDAVLAVHPSRYRPRRIEDHARQRSPRAAIAEASRRLLAGEPTRSDGKLTIKSLAVEAGVKRWILTERQIDLKDAFYEQVRGQDGHTENEKKPGRDRRVADMGQVAVGRTQRSRTAPSIGSSGSSRSSPSRTRPSDHAPSGSPPSSSHASCGQGQTEASEPDVREVRRGGLPMLIRLGRAAGCRAVTRVRRPHRRAVPSKDRRVTTPTRRVAAADSPEPPARGGRVGAFHLDGCISGV